jgi:hypothetical protein
MRRFTALALALAAVAAVSGLAAGSAAAKAPKLLLGSYESNGGEYVETPIAPGDNFDMVLFHISETEGFGANSFFIETSTGTATCEGAAFSGIRGTALTNGEVTDTVEMHEGEGTLAGGSKCSNTSPLGTEAEMIVIPDNAILNLKGGKGQVQLKAKSAAEPVYVGILYSGGALCYYKATTLKGTLAFAPQGEWRQVVLTFTKAKVKLVKELSSATCEKKATISASFGFQDRGEEGFGAGLFIFGRLI